MVFFDEGIDDDGGGGEGGEGLSFFVDDDEGGSVAIEEESESGFFFDDDVFELFEAFGDGVVGSGVIEGVVVDEEVIPWYFVDDIMKEACDASACTIPNDGSGIGRIVLRDHVFLIDIDGVDADDSAGLNIMVEADFCV